MLDFLWGEVVGEVQDEAVRNVADKTVFTSLFKSELLQLLPNDKYDQKFKEDFYEDLKIKKYIIQEPATYLSFSGDKFNYKEKPQEQFEEYLKNKINKDPKTDTETIENIINHYKSKNSILYWGGKKSKKTKSKHINKYKKTRSKRLHKKTLSKHI
jgi:uncharacterized protein (DUF2344 family)